MKTDLKTLVSDRFFLKVVNFLSSRPFPIFSFNLPYTHSLVKRQAKSCSGYLGIWNKISNYKISFLNQKSNPFFFQPIQELIRNPLTTFLVRFFNDERRSHRTTVLWRNAVEIIEADPVYEVCYLKISQGLTETTLRVVNYWSPEFGSGSG